MFNNSPLNVQYTGNMGDVVEVDLRKAVADAIGRELMGLPNAVELSESQMTAEQKFGLEEARAYAEREDITTSFSLDLGVVTRQVDTNAQLRLITESKSHIKDSTPLSRDGKDNLQEADFNKAGRLYLVPNLTEVNEASLRSGDRVNDKTAVITFRFQFKNAQGEWEWRQGIVNVTAKDIARVNTFFGDRPLDNPGYSELKLAGEGSVAAQNAKTIDKLDVYKVEQRLRYLGFPAMGTGSPTTASNVLQEFHVDGKFAAEETAAFKLFEKVVRYDATHTAFANSNGSVDNSNGADGVLEADQTNAQGKLTTGWLNAYNAPHWMQLFASTGNTAGASPFAATNGQLPSWRNSQVGTSNTNVENFGTSWMRDLMAAVQQAPADLLGGRRLLFNGATDANYGFTPKWNGAGISGPHFSHDLGMALDLGISDYVSKVRLNGPANSGNQYNANEPKTVTALAAGQVGWSIGQAISQSTNNSQLSQTLNYLVGTTDRGRNLQRSALGDFLSLYSVTRDNGILPGEMGSPSPVGSRTGLTLANGTTAQKELIRNALFGNGTSNGLISKVLVGGTGAQNPLKNFTQVLQNLGIRTSASGDHQNHFHVYLSPPAMQAMINSVNLLSLDAEPTGAVDVNPATAINVTTEPTTYSALIGAEEIIMLGFTVPAEPPATPALIVQAPAPSAPPTKEVTKTVAFCQDMTSLLPDSAVNSFSPLSVQFRRQIGARHDDAIDKLKPYRVKLVTPPQHGQVRLVDGSSQHWTYAPTEGYTGADRAIYAVENQGKRYKVIVNFWVLEITDENLKIQACESIKFGLTNGAAAPAYEIPATSMSDLQSWMRTAQLSALLNTASFNISSLVGGAVGQTTGTTITLGTNAAGHGWYVDPTPLDNKDDYLPTSQSTVWQAKAGSAAASKMDMLSVLLHEYGHALGLENSADSSVNS